MRLPLRLHPECRCEAVARIEVELERDHDGLLSLHYFAAVNTGSLALPQWKAPGRGDELWKHTCFEAFVRAPPEAAYHELNFSPSREWAAYRFSDYRTGMAVTEMSPPAVAMACAPKGPGSGAFELSASVDMSALPLQSPWHVGVSAVIEETNGRISYWALVHPPGKPDFHHRDCFAAELPAPSRS